MGKCGENTVCVDGELRENHNQKLVCKMRKRNSQTPVCVVPLHESLSPVSRNFGRALNSLTKIFGDVALKDCSLF